MNKILTRIFLAIAAIACAITANADPNWQGTDAATTEWGTSANWTANDGNHFWIDPWNNATHFNMTFNRDGRTYAGDPEDKSDGNWDFYNIWEVDIRGMTGGQIATWTGDGSDLGPNVRSILGIGREATRGALAINGGKVTVEGDVRAGWGSPNTGELVLNDGLLQIRRGIYLGMNSRRAKGVLALNGGTLKSEFLYFGNEMGIGENYSSIVRGKGTAQFRFDGGTIQIGADRQSYPVDGATFGANGLKVDTDGKNATLLETVNATVAPGATALVKKGAGTLATDAPIAHATTKVEAGTLKFATDGTRTLAHRWSFTSDASDSVTGENHCETLGTVTFSDGKAVLAGGEGADANDDCGLNLGANMWPADAMTLEIWATYRERTKWAKLFCWSGMHYSLQDDSGWAKFALMGTGGTDNLEATGSNIDAGSTCCYTITIVPNGTTGSHIRLCRWDASTGELLNSRDYDAETWRVSNINQENFWLGKSYWGGDTAAKADYDEVRIWKGVFADTELKEHVLLGPDTLPGGNGMGNTLNASAAEEIAANDYLLHRWTFNGTLEDSVGGATATLKGGAALDAASTHVKLPGGTKGAGWVDLGETGGFPTNDTPFTIELWATVHEYTKNRRIFSIGKRPPADSTDPAIDSSLQSGLHTYFADDDGSGKWWRLTARGGTDGEKSIGGNGWFETDKEYHIAATFVPDGNGNTAYYLYAYKANSDDAVGTNSGTITGWTPGCVNDVAGKMCCWLGHSQWGDNDAYADYDEVRIWNCALSPDQLAINRKLGPDRLPHITRQDTDRTFSLDIAADATADLCGNSATIAALSGAGTIANAGAVTLDGTVSPGGDGEAGTLTLNGNVTVTGTLRLDPGDKIVVNGSLDLSHATVELLADELTSAFVFATATDGITGTPAISATGGWNKRCNIIEAGDGLKLTRKGFMMIIK